MKIQHLNTAIAEAERFLERAKAAKAAHQWITSSPDATSLDYSNPRENGALRRASMDLTRALAELRGRAK